MSALVLDAGALIALDRNDRSVWAMLRAAADDHALVQVPAGVLGQVCSARSDDMGARQALLARALQHCEEVPLDGAQARAAGTLCRAAATHDVIDASVALVAAGCRGNGVTPLLTSDPAELGRLLDILDARQVRIVLI